MVFDLQRVMRFQFHFRQHFYFDFSTHVLIQQFIFAQISTFGADLRMLLQFEFCLEEVIAADAQIRFVLPVNAQHVFLERCEVKKEI